MRRLSQRPCGPSSIRRVFQSTTFVNCSEPTAASSMRVENCSRACMASSAAMAINAREFQYTVLLEPDEAGGFTVTVPALPGIVTQGETVEEALDMARDAIGLYLEDLVADGQEIPTERTPPRL